MVIFIEHLLTMLWYYTGDIYDGVKTLLMTLLKPNIRKTFPFVPQEETLKGEGKRRKRNERE